MSNLPLSLYVLRQSGVDVKQSRNRRRRRCGPSDASSNLSIRPISGCRRHQEQQQSSSRSGRPRPGPSSRAWTQQQQQQQHRASQQQLPPCRVSEEQLVRVKSAQNLLRPGPGSAGCAAQKKNHLLQISYFFVSNKSPTKHPVPAAAVPGTVS